MLDLDLNQALFLKGMKLLFNDGSSARSIVTFVGIEFLDGQQTCKVRNSDESITISYPESLHFIENPDIASILQTSEDHCRECTKLAPSQIKHILSLKPLSPLQEEMMRFHTRLHHLSFPKLIILLKKGEIPRCLSTLKDREPICIA